MNKRISIEKVRIETRIKELEVELEKFMAEANQTVFGYNAVIGELKRLIEPQVKSTIVETNPNDFK